MKGLIDHIQETVRSFERHNGSSYSAAIAYHAIISLGPLLLFSLAVASIAFDRAQVVQQLVDAVAVVSGRELAELVESIINELRRPTADNLIFAGVSLLVALYFASNVFRQLVIAMDAIWEIEQPAILPEHGIVLRTFLQLRRYFVGIFAAIAIIFSLLVSMVVNVLLGPLLEMIHVVSPLLAEICLWFERFALPILLVLLCLVAFKLLPSRTLRWRDIVPGATLTGLVLAGTEQLIGAYAVYNPIPEFFEVVGSVIIIMLWAFFSAFIFLFGAEFTHIYVTQRAERAARRAQQQADQATLTTLRVNRD